MTMSNRFVSVLVIVGVGCAGAMPTSAANSASPIGGGNILFVAQTDAGGEVREIAIDGSGEHVVRALPPSFSGGELLSPTGTAIAFREAAADMVFVMRLNDGGTTRVAANAGSVTWSPNGRQLGYITRGKAPQIFIVNADGTGRRRLGGASTRTVAAIRRGSALGSAPDRRAALYVDYLDLAGRQTSAISFTCAECPTTRDSRPVPVSISSAPTAVEGENSLGCGRSSRNPSHGRPIARRLPSVATEIAESGRSAYAATPRSPSRIVA
jgi:hypothetical protein